MAEGKSGRGSAASTKTATRKSGSKNETPNTPEVEESKIARMKVDELRKRLAKRGVRDTDKLHKDDLVKKLIKAERADAKSAATSGKSAGKKTLSSNASGAKSSGSKADAKGGDAKAGAKVGGGKSGGNETPNTPEVQESKIARMKVDELRKRLAKRGVQDTGKLRKDDLVKKLIKAELAESGKAGGRGPGAKAAKAAKSNGLSAKAAGSKGASAKASGSKGASAKTSGSKSASAKAPAAKGSSTKAAGSRSGVTATVGKGGGKGGGSGSGGVRTGKQTSTSVKYSQEITDVDQQPERDGRSLVTTDHEVIRRWAEARNAVPATIEGTEHEDHLGVLRFDFPGGDSGGRLRQVDWTQWLETFDKRRLNFIYQQTRSDGRQSNFFQLESPDREDG